MSESNCGGVERYQGLKEPKCLSGKGCDACWKKYKNPPDFSLPWLKRWRREAWAKMESFVNTARNTKVRQAKSKKYQKLLVEVEELRKWLRTSCPHLIETQRYEEHGREDSYGRYRGGRDYAISCKDCGITLASWGD